MQLPKGYELNLATAKAIVEAVERLARDTHDFVAVCIIGLDGQVIAAETMDGTMALAAGYAHGKARAALAFKGDTQMLWAPPEHGGLSPEELSMTVAMHPGLCPLGGGCEIRDEGYRLVGAIGVSGLLTCTEDHELVEVAARDTHWPI